MPTSKQVSRLKAEQIDKKQKAIGAKITTMQENLYDKVSTQFLTLLNKRDKEKDLPSTNQIQNIVKKEFNAAFPDIMREVVKSSRSVSDLNLMYYSTLLDSDQLDVIRDQTSKTIDRKLGIDENGKIKQGGFLDRAIDDRKIQNDFVKLVNKLMQSGQDAQSIQEKLKEFMIGSKLSGGFIEQYYKGFAGTLLTEIDRGNNLVYADKLQLNYFYYSGGLILSSRPFCIDKNGKILHRDQAERWKDDSRIKKMYGKEISSYVPLRDFGGPNCLHGADFITDDMAVGSIREQNKKAAERTAAFKNRNDL